MTNTIDTTVPFKQTKFENIVRHPIGVFSRTKPTWTGTGNSGQKFMIHSNGTWYYANVNFKRTSLGYKLDEVSESLKQL
jgi:hypothetical protein